MSTSVKLTDEQIEALILQASVILPRYDWQIIPAPIPRGKPIAVFASNDKEKVMYLGTVVDVYDRPGTTFSDTYRFTYDVCTPEGTIEANLGGERVASYGQPATPAIQTLERKIKLLDNQIENLLAERERYLEACRWAENGEVGYLWRKDRYGKAPKKKKGK